MDCLNAEIVTRFDERTPNSVQNKNGSTNPYNDEKLKLPVSSPRLADVDKQELKEELIYFAKCHTLIPSQYLGEIRSSTATDNSKSWQLPFCKGNCLLPRTTRWVLLPLQKLKSAVHVEQNCISYPAHWCHVNGSFQNSGLLRSIEISAWSRLTGGTPVVHSWSRYS